VVLANSSGQIDLVDNPKPRKRLRSHSIRDHIVKPMMPTIVISPSSSTRAVASEGVQKLKKVLVSEVAKHHATLGFGFSANSPTRETGPRTELGIEVAQEHIAKLVAMLRSQLMAGES